MNAAIALLPANNGVTSPTPTTNVLTSSGQTTGYTVTATASGSIATTFMGPFVSSMSVSVSATAENPVLTVTINGGKVSSSAADHNVIYMYKAPLDNSVPPQSALTQLYDNAVSSNAQSASINIPTSQNVRFALKNATGGLANYGSNGYGARQGHTQWMYSHLSPPSKKGLLVSDTKLPAGNR